MTAKQKQGQAKEGQAQTGEGHFAERARVAEETSDDSRFSTTSVVIPAKDGNGALSAEVRGTPTKGE